MSVCLLSILLELFCMRFLSVSELRMIKKKVYSVSFLFYPPFLYPLWHGILYCMSRRFQTQTPKSVCVPVCCFALLCLLYCFIEGGLLVGWLVAGLARSLLST
ncbi:uncharacterized protein BO87DRAFT_139774 [Aspergillus neoniger CBS 115656]|uniref:Uncharacterized protein n=1 Tax=Aspergillus neoniger (strain CBS 115656) TaxID=1448310 RepID=A0A318Y9V6_ASPNB|nr:hypothetical protein BO87DRAFT_139774 [Aspergillus neoniger CBS 115656]PYH31096.1 hypothetical protein BO87DRAFT_139774 [Aspergillus neoniger CBS 115656]